MDNNLIIVKILINAVSLKFMLINTSYDCYFVMDKDLITELRLSRVKILPKLITGFIRKTLNNFR